MTTTRPEDFDEYWDRVDGELRRYPAAAELEHIPLRSTEFSTAYNVRLTSIGPYRIFGYYSVPKGEGPFPALLNTPRYGSINTPPHYDQRERYAVLTIMHRGQRLADQPFQAAFPGLLTHGIEDPAAYIYRGIVADCVRGAEFLRSRPEVDAGRIGIAGDDMAILTAARRPPVAALHVPAANLLFYRMMEARMRTSAYPIEEVNDVLRTYPELDEAVARTVAYFDPVHHAPRVTAATLLSMGDPGSLSGPEWLEPLTGAFGGAVETYPMTHEGGTDHDWFDAWMAGRLGSEPRPRVWKVVEA